MACCNAALALDQTLPHPQPPAAPAEGVGVVAAVAALELGESVREIAGEAFEDETAPPPILTRSALFLNEGVLARDSGRSKWVDDRGGSELF